MLRTFVLALALSLPLAAVAQEATDRYRTLVDAALEESAAGRWEEARALFRQAHEVSPNARTLRGIGMASYELRDYAEAVRMLAAALDSAVTPLTDEQRAQVTELLGRARAFVGRYEVELPDGASLTVDGAVASFETDGSLLLDLGTHHLVGRREDRTVEADVSGRGGETGPLPLDLARLAERDEATVLADPIAVPVPRARETNAAPWVLVGVGGAAVVAGAICLGVGMADSSAIEGAMPGTPWSSVRDAYERVPVLQGVGGALLGIGAAAAVAGVVWAVAEPTHEVALSIGPTGFVVRGSM